MTSNGTQSGEQPDAVDYQSPGEDRNKGNGIVWLSGFSQECVSVI